MEQFLYTIVRYAPLSETGEFANIGVVLACPKSGYFNFELKTRKYARITHFFNGLDKNLYRAAASNLKLELKRMRYATLGEHGQMTLDFPEASLPRLFLQELLRKREGVIRFSNARMSIAEDPDVELQRLYKYYVDKDFVTPMYAEQIMEREIRGKLKKWHVSNDYVERRITDGVYGRRFPFVKISGDRAVSVIKPISLAQERPESIIEHANKWSFALKRFQKAGKLPTDIFLPVKQPVLQDSTRNDAYHEALQMLRNTGALVSETHQEAALQKYLAIH
ncbi:DUF3037 domain-containing protein [Ruegeria halocynthiae]|uniref:DUF3037 domain-containing protein n=1 Tax=Ruegeria halocynthiae TaxID=985054 RepID=UPI00068D4FF0|nr:DUF3037 domain-containing protein [Ruegeria halocynthiae]